MFYSEYYPVDFINGEGLRCTLFVSGCSHGCKGCYNEKTWHPTFGQEYTKELEDQIILDLKNEVQVRQGLSISGGDPMYKGNVESILSLVKRVRTECPTKDIWMWTGFTKEELEKDGLRSPILEYIDVLVDGRFDESLRDLSLKFRGSSNQRIHYLRLG